MFSSTTRVILVRHGRSTFNDLGRYQGSSNSSVLTQKGLETAQMVGTYFNQRFYTKDSESPIDFIYTSPLRRVQQTAEAISQKIPPSVRPPIIVNSDLKEISLSLWEGLSYDDVKRQYAEEYQTWQQRPEMFELPMSSTQTRKSALGGRLAKTTPTATATVTKNYFPVRQLYHAAQQFWRVVLAQHSGRTLLIVSHSGTIHALISTALGLSAQHHHSLQQSNCGISELTFCPNPDRESSASHLGYDVQLNQLNQTSVLGEILPKIKTNNKGLRLLLLPSEGLDMEGCQQLSRRIARLPLDFCIAADMTSAKLSALMHGCPSVMHIEAKSANFLQTWQQQLISTSRPDEPLMTALAIAPKASIQRLLLQTLSCQTLSTYSPISGSTSLNKSCIKLHPHQFSIIHYPYQHRPVVQAINTFSENAFSVATTSVVR